jgi:GNAT superfamily N-acetyltransferase
MIVKAIPREDVAEGFGDTFCAMYGARHRQMPKPCLMWEDLYDRVGGIGFRAVLDGHVAGQLIYMPKTAARRICLPICPTREAEDATLIVACLLVFRESRRQGVASALIRSLIEFAHAHDYHRIEANVSLKPPGDAELEHISYLPFKSAGFLIDEASITHGEECGPYYAGNRMYYRIVI